jgi:signal recognition particle subunit SRP54
MGNLKQAMAAKEGVDENALSRIEAMINSMTPAERANHQVINGSRRKRIAKGSGTSVEEINRLLKQFVQMKKMLKQLGGMAGIMGGGKKRGLGMMKSLMR